ncbi:MAG: hypothetical protein Q7R95_00700, partial [bacterium]|nr:hypothetical protein [bacterium]
LKEGFWGECKAINCLELLGPPTSEEYYEDPSKIPVGYINQITRQNFQYGYMTWNEPLKTLTVLTKDGKIMFQTVGDQNRQNCLCKKFKTTSSGTSEILAINTLNNFNNPSNSLFWGQSYSATAQLNMVKNLTKLSYFSSI